MLLVAGLGYSGVAAAHAAVVAGWRVTGTARDPSRLGALPGIALISFDFAGAALDEATHLLVTAPPGDAGDPLLVRHHAAIEAALIARRLRWIGYISTTGVYGDRGGGLVEESTPPAPGQPRSIRRLAAEESWRAIAAGRAALDIFRAGGIYGPGRSTFDDLRAGTARCVVKPGHAFSRIHRDDIAHAVLAAIGQDLPPAVRVLHLVDDEAVESAVVTAHAARLLGLPPPPAIPFEQARAAMSPMALSFWSENRRVANAATKAALGIAWRYPTYREGLEAILAEERREGLAQ
ncbi:SDR family NAD(P)-dependent oxidoreductase [Roseomonas sp. PWR1]|uniref:SDR family NAD(P)-dependent oxidoreductase n=1 Tax=Roseomonas nitratireducens TaxID=2820810 RepID=A0ABS4AQT8_9PROT|nr:SDR family NAD(P)-dependent oxidoreductase [Neoroseomonas nitratireducens]MBP0463729.1 SDR family NAD(P)-dependent oxidoreductase [Neoroseomonas nitratireducens]